MCSLNFFSVFFSVSNLHNKSCREKYINLTQSRLIQYYLERCFRTSIFINSIIYTSNYLKITQIFYILSNAKNTLVYTNISKSKGIHTKPFTVVIWGGRMMVVRDSVFPSHIFPCCLNFYRICYYFCKPQINKGNYICNYH